MQAARPRTADISATICVTAHLSADTSPGVVTPFFVSSRPALRRDSRHTTAHIITLRPYSPIYHIWIWSVFIIAKCGELFPLTAHSISHFTQNSWQSPKFQMWAFLIRRRCAKSETSRAGRAGIYKFMATRTRMKKKVGNTCPPLGREWTKK